MARRKQESSQESSPVICPSSPSGRRSSLEFFAPPRPASPDPAVAHSSDDDFIRALSALMRNDPLVPVMLPESDLTRNQRARTQEIFNTTEQVADRIEAIFQS